MSQVFAADGVSTTVSVVLPTSGSVAVITGNFVNPPFQNAKAVVSANAALTSGSGATNVNLQIRRNPNAENVVVGQTGNITVTAAANYAATVQMTDVIPDARPVQYQLVVSQTGATGPGSVYQACIGVLLISG